jgi:hypothetical protein
MRDQLFLALLSVALLAGCRRETPEALIRKVFDGCVQAVEAGDAAKAAQGLSPKFTGPEGMDLAGARLYLRGILARERVGVHVLTRNLAVRGTEAVQTVEVVFTGRSGGGLLPDEGSRRSLVLRWERRDGDWKIREIQESGNK